MFIPAQRPAGTALRAFDRSVFNVEHRTAWRVRMIHSVPFPSGPRLLGRKPSHSAPSSDFRTPQSVDNRRAPLPAGARASNGRLPPVGWTAARICGQPSRCIMRLVSPFWALVSRTASIVVRRCAFPEQSGAPRERILRFAHSLRDDLRPLCASRRRSLGEAANWDTRPPSGEWGPSFTSSPTRTKQVRTERAQSTLMQQTRTASASSAVTGQAALPVGPRSTLRQHLKSGPLQHGDGQRASRRDPCRRRARKGGSLCAPLTAAMRRIYRLATCAMFHVKQGLSFQRPGLRRHARGPGPDASPSGQDFLRSDGAQHWTPAVLVGARDTLIDVGKVSGLAGIWPRDLGRRYSRSDVTSVLSRPRAEELRHWLTTLTHDLAEPQRRDPHSHSRALLSARIAG